MTGSADFRIRPPLMIGVAKRAVRLDLVCRFKSGGPNFIVALCAELARARCMQRRLLLGSKLYLLALFLLLFKLYDGDSKNLRQVLSCRFRKFDAPGMRVVTERAVFLDGNALGVLSRIVMARCTSRKSFEARIVDVVADRAVLLLVDCRLLCDRGVTRCAYRTALGSEPLVLLVALRALFMRSGNAGRSSFGGVNLLRMATCTTLEPHKMPVRSAVTDRALLVLCRRAWKSVLPLVVVAVHALTRLESRHNVRRVAGLALLRMEREIMLHHAGELGMALRTEFVGYFIAPTVRRVALHA